MSKIKIKESGMQFELDSSFLFHIEQDACVKGMKGVKRCEFITWTDNTVTFVEARSSFPNAENSPMNFCNEIDEIAKKFIHSFEIFVSSLLGRLPITLPDSIGMIDLNRVKFELFFILKDFPKSVLPPISEALKRDLKVFLDVWKIRDCDIKVINSDIALAKNIIISTEKNSL